MKKIICLFLPAVMLFLSACGQKKNELTELNPEITYGNPPDIIFQTEKEVYTQDDTVINYTVTYTGNTEFGVNANPHYELHKLENGKWMEVVIGDYIFTMLIRILTPEHPKQNYSLKLDEYYHVPLEKGTYRIADDNLITNTFKIE